MPMRTLRSIAALAASLLMALPAQAEHSFVSFAKGELTIETAQGAKKFAVELATDEAQRAQGLSYRMRLGPDAGMLFIYQHEQPMAMWMKDTILPLDMVFIGADGRIRNIQQRAVPNSLAIIPSDGPVKAALELNAGTVERLGIKPGDRVTAAALEE